MNVGGKLSEDMGSRIKRPLDFQGITRKEANNKMPTDGTFTLEGAKLNQQLKHWNEASEEHLAQKEGKTGT
eukprot:14758988-Heterocapsa_arctica.AAC.1